MQANTNTDVLKRSIELAQDQIENLPTPILIFLLRLGLICFTGYVAARLTVEHGNRMPPIQWVVFLIVALTGAAVPIELQSLNPVPRSLALLASVLIVAFAPWILPDVLVNTPAQIEQLRRVMIRVWILLIPLGIVASQLLSQP